MKLEVLESIVPTRSNEITGSRELRDNRYVMPASGELKY